MALSTPLWRQWLRRRSYDGTMKRTDWAKLPKFPPPPGGEGKAETRWVFPETFEAIQSGRAPRGRGMMERGS